MLTGLKVSSLNCECVFHRTQYHEKGGIPLNWILKALKWNKPKDRAQRVDEENGVICLAILFTSRVMAFKMSEMAIFFSPDNSKILVTIWAISLSTRGRSLCPNWVCFFSI